MAGAVWVGAGSVPDGLRSACEDVTEAGPGDTVDGVPARWVARPDDTPQTAAVLRAAAELGLRVVARGSGTRLSWGAPPQELDLIVDTSRMRTVLEHAAGDLVVSTQAGVRLSSLQNTLARRGQRLALDTGDRGGAAGRGGGGVGGSGGGTVGGAVATGAAGPLRYRYGAVRDLIIGVTVVLADGTVARSGGKVVKNVAGYDLAKLYTGSLGTLGVITEAVFRLHPLPDATRWITVTVPGAAGAPEPSTERAPELATAALDAVRDSQHEPVALEVDRVVRDGPITVGVAIEGVAAGIDTRARAVADLLGRAAGAEADIARTPPDWWGLAPSAGDRPAVAVTCQPTGLADLLGSAPGSLRGSAGAGVLVAGLDNGERLGSELAELRRIAARHGGHAVLRCAPPDSKAELDLWGPVPTLALMRRVKDEFDPEHRLAPGRFVGGI